ncbi:hypothetical protein ACOSP7_001710 [Xanthoceras sorbifolium]
MKSLHIFAIVLMMLVFLFSIENEAREAYQQTRICNFPYATTNCTRQPCKAFCLKRYGPLAGGYCSGPSYCICTIQC